MNMTRQRFSELLAAYGADYRRWPAQERQQALAFAERDEQAHVLLAEAARLDRQLDDMAVPVFNGLESRLLQQALPARQPNLLDRLMTWLTPQPGHVISQFWRPAIAASLPLVLGLYIGGQLELGLDGYGTDVYTLSSIEEELYLISLSDYAEMM